MESSQGEELKNVHYTFDFAQHFQLPHHARQMGPTYFIQLHRVQLFGVRIDSTSLQLNYLIDENQTISNTHTYIYTCIYKFKFLIKIDKVHLQLMVS